MSVWKPKKCKLRISNQVDVTLQSDDVLPEFVVTAQSAICHGRNINTCGDPYRYIQGLSAEFIEHKEIPTLSLSILGNPFKDFFVLNINSEKEEKGLVSLYNIEGKILKTIPVNLVKGDNRLEVNDVSNLPVGSYTVTVNILNKEQPTVVVRDSFLQITQSVFELMKKEKPEQDINRKQNIIPLNKKYYELLLMSNAFMTKAAHIAKMYKQDVPESTYLWELRQHKDSEEIQPYMAEIEDLVKDYRKIEEKQKLMDNKKEFDDIDKTFVLEVLYHSNADQYYLYLIKKEVITC